MYIYLVKRIRDSKQWPKGCCIWVDDPCPGWRVIAKRKVSS